MACPNIESSAFIWPEEETVVRPGLVIGAGGMFGRNLRTMRSLRIIPWSMAAAMLCR